jgi:hypothetical protein
LYAKVDGVICIGTIETYNIMETTDESLYTEALKALINSEGFYSYQKELLLYSDTYWDKILPNEIGGKTIVFVNSKNEETILKENNNAIEVLSFEPPKIDGDELIVKINHTLCLTTLLPANENSWSKKLTDKDKKQIKDSVGRTEGIKESKELKSLNSGINNKWTYAKLKFDNTKRKFKITGLETKVV